jgi:hypothetical protein
MIELLRLRPQNIQRGLSRLGIARRRYAETEKNKRKRQYFIDVQSDSLQLSLVYFHWPDKLP